jgi:hypothetical protein
MGDRDFLAEMDALIDAWAKPAHCVPGVVAARIIETVDPVLLDGWLRQRATEILASAIAKHKRATAAASRASAAPRAFEKARREAAGGDVAALSSFTAYCTVDAKKTRRRVADMTGADHEFVAAGCEKEAKSAALLAEFHRQVARKVGSNRTSDVLSEKQYDQLYHSIVRPRALEAVV